MVRGNLDIELGFAGALSLAALLLALPTTLALTLARRATATSLAGAALLRVVVECGEECIPIGLVGGTSRGSTRRLGAGLAKAVVLLAPVLVVHVVVVVARRRDADFEEVVVGGHEQCGSRHEAAARVAEYPDLVHVDPRVPLRQLLDARLLIGQAVVAQVVVAVAVVGVGTRGVATTVADLDHDEPELCQPLVARRSREGGRHAFGLRPGVDVQDDGVLVVRAEVERLPHVAVDVGDAVGGFHLERLGHHPADFLELGQVNLLQQHDLFALVVADDRARGHVRSRVDIHDVVVAVRERRVVVGIARIEQHEVAAVELHPVEVLIVRVLVRLASVAAQVDRVLIGVHLHDLAGSPRAGRDRVLQLAVVVVQVEVAESGPLGEPDEVASGLDVVHVLPLEERVLDGLFKQHFDRAGVQRHLAELQVPLQPVSADEAQDARGLGEVDVEQLLVFVLAYIVLAEFLLLAMEDEELRLGDLLFARHRILVDHQRWSRLVERVDQEQVGDLARVAARDVKVLGVLGPRRLGAHAILAVLAALPALPLALLRLADPLDDGVVVARAVARAEREAHLAVLGQLDDVGFLLGFHIEQVVVFGVDVSFAVGREVAEVLRASAKAWRALLLLLLLLLLAFAFAFSGAGPLGFDLLERLVLEVPLVLHPLDCEPDGLGLLGERDRRDRQVGVVERLLQQFREGRRHFVTIEQRRLLLGLGVHAPEVRAI